MHFLFAWRYFRAKKSTNAINIIAWTSVVAIVIGSAALVLVLGVFNGFEGLVKSLYSSFYTDLKVSPAAGKTMMIDSIQLQRVKHITGIRNYSLVAEEKALVQNGDYHSIVYIKGVDPQYRYTTGVASHIVHGKYDLGNADQPRMILGAGLEAALGVISDLNDYPLIAYLPRKGNTEQLDPLENISIDSVYTSAAFLIQQDFDNKYGITNIDFLKRAMQFKPDEYSGLEISLTDKSGTGQVKNELRQIFGKDYLVLTRYEQNRSLYAIMNVERWVIYSVLCLILVVAAFNMIGALTMLVLEKQKDISILHALGGNQSFIRKIFLSEGLILALVGCGSGMLLALLVAWLQITFHLIPLPGSFLISYYPVKLRVADFVLVGSTVFLIALIASWLPARKAAAQEYALRSE